MRQRNKPWAKKKLAEYGHIAIAMPEDFKGKWKQEVFGNNHPLHIEIGTGKGRFLSQMALRNPDINYVGIEIQESVIVTALDKVIENDIKNLRLCRVDASHLINYFDANEVDRIYLNFSDPWPKKRHAKRRLTSPIFLKSYEEVLTNNGEIHFKTDNQGLFEYSLMSFSEYGLTLHFVNLDLHNSDYEGNIMTEYEEKFSSRGFRIYRLEAKFRK